MKKHVSDYFKHFGYTHQGEVFCELCGRLAQDLHHIEYGRYKRDDSVENIIALCRPHHENAHAGIIAKYKLKEIHEDNLNRLRG